MSTTPALALADLYALLAADSTAHASQPVAALSALGVAKVYDHEPGSMAAEVPVSVTLCHAGWTDTEWLIDCRVYVSDQSYDPQRQQEILASVAYTVDQTIRTEGPSQSDASYESDLKAWVQTTRYQVGREDF